MAVACPARYTKLHNDDTKKLHIVFYLVKFKIWLAEI